ncbi:CoA-binding protein [Candidatus Micrarchaeota archaeon]|nr:CoA-binding protein [Candidatus Micrarchaeota archaeon]
MASKQQIKNLKFIFEPKSIALVGASPTPNKVSNVIFKSLTEGNFQGEFYPVNPKYQEITGIKCYPSISSIKKKIDCLMIATPAQTVPMILQECARLKIKGVVLVTAGFSEAGEEGTKLERQIKEICDENEIALIGPNCLGTLNPSTGADSIFLPMHKLERPKPGNIAFITQSGAVGSTIIDVAAYHGIGISKFISYGNATVLDEVDLLEYLEKDNKTKTIVVYIEGARRGREFFEAMKRINKKKPIIALKAGKFSRSAAAAKSHTGNIAGSYLAYNAAFRQAKVIEAEGLEDLFDFMKIFSQPLAKGKRVGIITNGGGMGVLTADAVDQMGLEFAEFSAEAKVKLKTILPSFGNVANPLDLIAEADGEKYEKGIEIMMDDPAIDALFIITLFQTPPMDERVLNVLIKASDDHRKPIACIMLGGAYTTNYQRYLDKYKVPSYNSPIAAVKAMKKFIEYSRFREPKR